MPNNINIMKILIIGGGNMGLTYAQSFLRTQNASKDDMMILEKSPDRAAELSRKDIGTVFGDAIECVPLADIVILAVKPQDAKIMFASLKDKVHHQQVFLSIMAGVKIDQIKEGLGTSKVIRAMPNLPAQIGRGMTAFTSSEEVTRIELITVQNLLNTTGKTVYVENEKFIDAATAISGSGPAYVFLFMDSMISAARGMGFSPAEAELLVSQTFLGATELYNSGDYTCQEWIQKVSSKGGTTEAAMQSFEQQQVKNHIITGANAALHRAIELGKGN